MRPSLAFCIGGLLALVLATNTLAQDAPGPPTTSLAQPASAPASQVPANAAPTRGGQLSLRVSEGRLLRLDRDAVNVLVGDSSIADVQVVSPRTLYIYGRRPGDTTLSAVDGENGVAAQLQLRITRGPGPAQNAIPTGGGTSVGFVGNRLVLRGTVSDIGQALDANASARAFNQSSLPPLDRTQLEGAQTVTLRVRIAEVSRTTLDRLGVNLSVLANPGSFAFSLVTGSFLGAAAGQAVNTGIGAAANSFGNASAAVATRRINAEALLDALQSENLLTLLAEPNLTTISGQEAKFLAGGEIPIPVPQSFGVTTIEYKRYGVQLSFTPTLLPGDRIAMRVRPEVSEISSANAVTIAGTSVPSFLNRSAETNVEMASGQTLAIAGLFQRTDQTTLEKFPFLGDVPVLGTLFRSRSYQRDETELVILVTPYLAQPVSDPNAFRLPTEGLDVAAAATSHGPATSRVRAGFVVE